MNSKKKLKFIEEFSCCNHDEMQKTLEILQNTANRKRIEEETKFFDDRRANGALIEEFDCKSVGHDELGMYETYHITLRIPEIVMDKEKNKENSL